MMALRLLVLALAAGHACAHQHSERARRPKKYDTAYRFMQLTDVHIEPFYNPDNGHAKGGVCRVDEAFNKTTCVPFRVEPEASSYPFGRLNCDPPMALLRSLLEHMTRVAKHAKPEFVVFTGDVPSHQLSCQYHQARTIQLVTETLARELKDVAPKFYPAMGNNDYFPNYNISLEGGSIWQRYVAGLYGKEGVLSGEQLETFGFGGFYSATPREGLRLLVLNTVAWSTKVLDWGASSHKHVAHHWNVDDEAAYDGPDAPFPGSDDSNWHWDQDVADAKEFIACEDRHPDPYGQLVWMKAQLQNASAAGERVIIAGHVPPGNKAGDNNYCEGNLADLEALTREFADIIEVQLYGDHSNDEFRMIWSEGEKPKAVSTVLVSAGVTPRKHCNPSWRLFEVSSNHEVHDFTQFYLPLVETDIKWSLNPKWTQLHKEGRDEEVSWKFWRKQYSWREEYGVGLDPDELESVWLTMQHKPPVLERYLRHMFSETVGGSDYFDYICDMRYLGKEDNERCAAEGRLLGPAQTAEADLELSAEAEESLSALFPADDADAYIRVHPMALLAMALTCGALLASTVLLALRLRGRDATPTGYATLA